MKKSTKRKLGTGLMVTAGVLLLAGTVALGVKTKGFTDWKWAGNMTKLGTVVEHFEITGLSELMSFSGESTKSKLDYECTIGTVSNGTYEDEIFTLGAEVSDQAVYPSDIDDVFLSKGWTNSQKQAFLNNVMYDEESYGANLGFVINIDDVITEAKDEDDTLLKVPYFDVVRINFVQEVGHQIVAESYFENADEELEAISQLSYVEKSLLNEKVDLNVKQPAKGARQTVTNCAFSTYGLHGEKDTRAIIESIELVKTSVGHYNDYRYISFGA